MTSYQLTFITPLFSKGSYEDRPEVRAASIRGQLHWWFRALGGKPLDENIIFGSIQPVQASKIVVRVGNVQGQTREVDTLPHKQGKQASPKWAFKPGASFELHLLERLGGLSAIHRAAFQRTLETWLLLGTLGLRATRASGSFSWEPLTKDAYAMPSSLNEWKTRCSELLKNAPLKIHLTSESFATAEEARRVVSDTIGGVAQSGDWQSLNNINWPLGNVITKPQRQQCPSAPQRKTSPFRFRIIPIDNRFHIAAVWDDRSSVTGNRPNDLIAVIEVLKNKNKKIGHLLDAFQ